MTAATGSLTQTLEQPLASISLTGEEGPAPALAPYDVDYKYARFLPTWDKTVHYPPLEPFEHVDPGHKALNDAHPRSFLDSAKVDDSTPGFGSVIKGIQLSKLTTHEREQLALYVAQRGVVAFRDQDFVDQSPEWQLQDWGAFFGRLHIHPTSGAPAGIPELHLIHRHNNVADFRTDDKLIGATWHSDVTYELQPPGLTTLFLYDTPKSGGDTSFTSLVAAYNKLSPSYAAYLETLSAVHSGFEQAAYARNGGRGGTVRREPVSSVHPLIRRHAVTGAKAIFVNRGFTRSIVGLKKEESDSILNLLYTVIAEGVDLQARIRWRPKTVVLWDNRLTVHSATVDWDSNGPDARRHGARITPQAERPTL